MWIKAFVLVAVASITRISGLQSDLGPGYSYLPPEDYGASTSIHQSLAYYINIPANEKVADYFYVISRPEDQHGRGVGHYRLGESFSPVTAPQDFLGHNGLSVAPSQSFGLGEPPVVPHSGLGAQYSPSSSGFSPFVPSPDLGGHSSFASFVPSHTYSTYGPPTPHQFSSTSRYQQLHNPLPLPTSNLHHHLPAYRSQQQQFPADIQPQPRHAFPAASTQDHRHPSVPSQELIPPPYSPHVTVQVAPKSLEPSAPQQYRIVPSMASLPMSLNVQLPFPIGAVPIKFRPLPLKTHLRQAGLLPITSYQARESYRK